MRFESAEIVLGYKTYLDLIADLLQNKTVISSGMRKEVERCQAAIEHALSGRNVALISSGDAGIYGMAGLVLDICREKRLNVFQISTPCMSAKIRSLRPRGGRRIFFCE